MVHAGTRAALGAAEKAPRSLKRKSVWPCIPPVSQPFPLALGVLHKGSDLGVGLVACSCLRLGTFITILRLIVSLYFLTYGTGAEMPSPEIVLEAN